MKKVFKIKNRNDINNAISEISNITDDIGFQKFEMSKIVLAISEVTTNIIKHANEGIVRVKILPNKNGIEILIKDSGEGIVNVEKAQQKGYTTVEGSLGLGLYIAKKVIDEFYISSKLGEGTEVILKHFLPISTEKVEYGISIIIDKNNFYSCKCYVKEELKGDTILFGIIFGTLVNRETSIITDEIREVIIHYKMFELKDIIVKCNEIVKKSKYIEDLHYGLILLKPDHIEYFSFGKIFIKIIEYESNIELFNQSRIVSKKTTDDLNIVKRLIGDKVLITMSTFDYEFKLLSIETSHSAQNISEIIINDLNNDCLASKVLVLKRKGAV